MTSGPDTRSELTLEEELAVISRGAEEVFPAAELADKLAQARREGRPLRVKLGVDPTYTELHIGHVIPVLKLRQFQDLGHQAVLIIGDYTAMVGDPTGRNKARPQLTHEEVLANSRTFQDQLFKILDPKRTEVVYNGTWFAKMGFAEVIRLLSQMTVARMLEREDFGGRFRSNTPISLHELVYPLMQGYDSAMVKADIELGGMDQKFNILVGRDIQREFGQAPQVGVCNPILLGTDGREKMSKSLGNCIWLTDAPDQMYGKTMSIPDDLMWMYFELITQVPMSEIESMRQGLQEGHLHPRDIKRRLAREVTARFHGMDAALQAESTFDLIFAQQGVPDDIPVARLDPTSLVEGRIWIVKLLVQAGLVASNGEARRLIQQGGVRIDGEVIQDTDFEWPFVPEAVVQVGKRRFAKVELEGATEA